ncbi:hypothetical protein COCC4DRAFT_57200 [Bipolaris maydis ATCC 48331]|uniref:Uncharacterized protein n=2 Tax=Cochliobolus heterostrophus TaxID=5016 RepID=M2UVD6_COCH5|nr:uncharacterized protein COCC4DRAFT_57200 [Bipolaris maydis ATCC 48331]EMD88316.1 hypothetical protein COCHEDRAFT_1033625 [Bipolaris maydis C5]EMD91782.1 hypothetical protein COCHEDRAFT_1030547 [Bipolaris maydis C5]ENI08460.1 hypothetical protein COCC4DRAFT_57200 [Bipolaris maydis ATCC 48331]
MGLGGWAELHWQRSKPPWQGYCAQSKRCGYRYFLICAAEQIPRVDLEAHPPRTCLLAIDSSVASVIVSMAADARPLGGSRSVRMDRLRLPAAAPWCSTVIVVFERAGLRRRAVLT